MRTDCGRQQSRASSPFLVIGLLAWLALPCTSAGGDATRLETWDDLLAWVEANGWKVVSLPFLSGELVHPIDVTPETQVDPLLLQVAEDEWVHYALIDDRFAVLRPPLKYRSGSPQHMTELQELTAAALELLANLSDKQWSRLAAAPVVVGDLPPRSRAAYRQFRQLALDPPESGPDRSVFLVVYSPWVVLGDGNCERRLPLRTDIDAWMPAVERDGDGWVYANTAAAHVLRPQVGDLLAPFLEDEEAVEVVTSQGALRDMLTQLAPGAQVDPDVGECLVRFTPGQYRRGRLLTAVLEATASVLKEMDSPGRVLYMVSHSPGVPPPELPKLAQARLAESATSVMQVLAQAPREQLAAELGVPPEEVACGTRRFGELSPAFREHLAQLVRIHGPFLPSESATMPALGPDTSVTLAHGVLVGYAEYSDAGEWQSGYSIIIDGRGPQPNLW